MTKNPANVLCLLWFIAKMTCLLVFTHSLLMKREKKKKKVNLMGFAIHFSFVREHFLQTVERLFPSIEKFVLMWLKCTI